VTSLPQISLWKTKVSDGELLYVKKLNRLMRLSLDETGVTDEGLKDLHGTTQLNYLSVWRTKVSDAGVDELKKQLPKLKVNR
jgi:hypothetical protein